LLSNFKIFSVVHTVLSLNLKLFQKNKDDHEEMQENRWNFSPKSVQDIIHIATQDARHQYRTTIFNTRTPHHHLGCHLSKQRERESERWRAMSCASNDNRKCSLLLWRGVCVTEAMQSIAKLPITARFSVKKVLG
jgi:hypothetical protein